MQATTLDGIPLEYFGGPLYLFPRLMTEIDVGMVIRNARELGVVNGTTTRVDYLADGDTPGTG